MRIEENSVKSLKFKGIYSITSKDDKRYIGSTKKSFLSRFKSHFEKLRSNNHPNEHLQNSWNKNGIDHFIFEIIEIINDNESIINNEKKWIEFYKSFNRTTGYNIIRDPLLPATYTKEVRDKISKIIKQKYKNGEMTPNKSTFKKGIIPWNKGKKYESTDHLKVPKTQTDKLLSYYKNKSNNQRENAPCILIYDINNNYLGEWRSSKDIEDFSKTELNNLPIRSRFSGDLRMGIPVKVLQSVNINKSCKTGLPYKNLYFKYKNQANLKQGELLENPITVCEDNQQPSLISNDFEGSTTNSQIQTSNIEDGNRDTSALPGINNTIFKLKFKKDWFISDDIV